MSLDDMDLYPVRMSLVDIRAKAFERFEGMNPEELSTYFEEGMSSVPYESSEASLNNLQHLINFYVGTRKEEFQEEYRWRLMGNIRPNEVERETTVEGFLSSVSFDFYLNYSEMLGTRDDLGEDGLSEKVNEERIRVAKKMVWKGQRSERKG